MGVVVVVVNRFE